MYKSFTGSEYKKFLGLPDDYHVDGMLIYGTWNRQKQVEIFKEALADSGFKAGFNALPNFLERLTEFTIEGKRYWFDVSYGGALLSELLHLACLFGSKKNILLGTCGGLSEQVSSCDFIIPTYSWGNESITRIYCPEVVDNKHMANSNLVKNIKEKVNPKYKVWEGGTITNQAMMGETADDVKKWSTEGFLGVEMEAATVFAVSNHFVVPAAALLYIGDNLIKDETVLSSSYGDSKDLREEVRKEQYRAALSELINE